MTETSISVRSRELGYELRQIRERFGDNATEFADRLEWLQSKLSRMETGKRGATEIDVALILGKCDVPAAERKRLLDLTRELNHEYYLKFHPDDLPDRLIALSLSEDNAHTIDQYQHGFIPGLAQTESYIEALFIEGGLVSPDQFDMGLQARLNRQQILHRLFAPHCRFLIHEDALRTVVGNAKIMHDQLTQLLSLDMLPYCSIRVVPSSTGARGRANSPFSFMSYREHLPVVFVELDGCSLFLDRPEQLDPYRNRWNRLDAVALGGEQSREFLTQMIELYGRAEVTQGERMGGGRLA